MKELDEKRLDPLNYVTPEIEVIEIEVERGFSDSPIEPGGSIGDDIEFE